MSGHAEVERGEPPSEIADLYDALGREQLPLRARASGAAIVLCEGIRRVGSAPSEETIRAIVQWLRGSGRDVFASECFERDARNGAAPEFAPVGLLAVPIARELGEYLLWFRPAARDSAAGRGSPAWAPDDVEAALAARNELLAAVRHQVLALRNSNQRLVHDCLSKDEFIAAVSHELRNPLNVINGWVALLKSGNLSTERRERALDVIERNVQSQSKLVEALLEALKLTRGEVQLDCQDLDLRGFIEGTLEACSPSISARALTLKRELARDLGQIQADPERLRQVLTNLISNAIKFTPAGGEIRVSALRTPANVELVVSDTGSGISADFLPNVFEAYRQAGPPRVRSGGLGLGLTIVKRIVELHRGEVAVESPGLGCGATFRVLLPTSLPHVRGCEGQAVPAPAAAVADAPALSDVRILLVEDSADSCEVVRMLLERDGAEVASVPDALAALRMLDGRSFDVILSDVGLPVVDGLEFIQLLRSTHSRDVPAVALTARARESERAAILQAGFQAHLAKPATREQLVATIGELLAKSSGRERDAGGAAGAAARSRDG
jgi:signal transduction histidine kinase/ActR/RegA family two-component response regulator